MLAHLSCKLLRNLAYARSHGNNFDKINANLFIMHMKELLQNLSKGSMMRKINDLLAYLYLYCVEKIRIVVRPETILAMLMEA